jgi:hypothetical protein
VALVYSKINYGSYCNSFVAFKKQDVFKKYFIHPTTAVKVVYILYTPVINFYYVLCKK